MTLTSRPIILLLVPLLSFGAGALIGKAAARTAKLVAPEPVTLLDAVALEQDDAIFRMVSAGEDPGRPVALESPVFHWKRGETTSPLLIAVAAGQLNTVAYMLKHTKRLAESPNDQALCVGARFRHSRVVQLLIKRGVPAVPRGGCGELARPEDIALKYGSGGLANELRRYRIEAD